MTAEEVKSVLDVLIAFANKQPIQFRDMRPGAMHSKEWLTVNPDTTEFRIVDLHSNEWRVKP